MITLGLIGYPLGHSFSKKYFEDKFQKLGLENDYNYQKFELPNIELFPSIWEQNPNLLGVNVTIPYKLEVKKYLHKLDESAQKVGAVNVIKKINNQLIGYNSDYYGFKGSLEKWLPEKKMKALILGTGGASKAVQVVLEDLNIPFHFVSRKKDTNQITYQDLHSDSKIIDEHTIIINTTPLGMSPNIATFPDLPYHRITENHYFYDLVYNPEMTQFLSKAKEQKANIMGGLEMLILQAEKSWEIWTTKN